MKRDGVEEECFRMTYVHSNIGVGRFLVFAVWAPNSFFLFLLPIRILPGYVLHLACCLSALPYSSCGVRLYIHVCMYLKKNVDV